MSPQAPRPKPQAPDGVLVVDKTEGPTSHDVVTFARRALGVSRIGHTGTLDPMATGVLVLVAGRATRLARFMTHDVKAYQAEVTFGRSTTTWDAEGATVTDSGLTPDREALAAAVAARRGAQMQTPPAYSAKKVGGEVAHRAARRDAPLVLAPVPVVVHALTLDTFADGVATLSMRVSAGFYVRALAHELGAVLGTGAHLSGLRRTAAGSFDLSAAVSWEALATAARGGLIGALLPLERLLPDLPAAHLTATATAKARHGQTVQAVFSARPGAGPVRLLDDDGRLVGIAETAEMVSPTGQYVPGSAAEPRILRPVVILS